MHHLKFISMPRLVMHKKSPRPTAWKEIIELGKDFGLPNKRLYLWIIKLLAVLFVLVVGEAEQDLLRAPAMPCCQGHD